MIAHVEGWCAVKLRLVKCLETKENDKGED
jgi:hypothetical protein